MKWSDTAWEEAAPVFRKILEHPFITELAAGTLSRDRFAAYLVQDSLYLREYARVMSLIASRLGNPEHAALFLASAMENLDSEKEIHDLYLDGTGLRDIREPAMSPACLMCSSHLWRQAAAEPLEIALASVLPCFVVYDKTGKSVYAAAALSLDSNPYREWISLYGSGSFDDSTARITELCNDAAAASSEEMRKKMTEAFVTGVKMEWMFWNSAYIKEQWTI